MIEAKTAYHNVILHQTRKPVSSVSTISEMVRAASLLGFESLDVIICAKNEKKIREKLKQSGYVLEVTYARTLPDDVFLKIKWVTSKFIDDTIREISGE